MAARAVDGSGSTATDTGVMAITNIKLCLITVLSFVVTVVILINHATTTMRQRRRNSPPPQRQIAEPVTQWIAPNAHSRPEAPRLAALQSAPPAVAQEPPQTLLRPRLPVPPISTPSATVSTAVAAPAPRRPVAGAARTPRIPPPASIQPARTPLTPPPALRPPPPLQQPQPPQQPQQQQSPPLHVAATGTLGALQEAFKRYGHLHKRIVAGLEKPRFVLVHPWGGMNNNLLPFVSGLLFGMLTDRAVLLHIKPKRRVMSPSAKGHVFADPGFDWDLMHARPALQRETGRASSAAVGGKRQEFRMQVPASMAGVIPAFPTELLACGDYAASFTAPVVDLHANQWWGGMPANNPRNRQRIAEWFSHVDAAAGQPGAAGGHRALGAREVGALDVFGPLARLVLRPTPSVLQEKARLQRAAFRGRAMQPALGGRCIGLQFRWWPGFGNFGRSARLLEDSATACTAAIAQDVVAAGGAKPVVYLATDDKRWRATLKRRLVATGAVANVVWVPESMVPIAKLVDEGSIRFGLVETLMLADCALGLVTTSHSTFGYTATALSKAPLDGGRLRRFDEHHCRVLTHRQPTQIHALLPESGAALQDASCFDKTWTSFPSFEYEGSV